MKRTGIRFILALAFMVFFSFNAEAQLRKKNRPPKPERIEETIPQPPSRYHVWESGSWKWKKKDQDYIWRAGYWRLPHPSEYGPGFYGYGFAPFGFYSPYAFRFGRRFGYARNPLWFYW